MKLKTLFSILGICLLSSSAIYAQEADRKKLISPWSFGAKLGVNVYDYDNTTEIGLNLGGVVEVELVNNFFLRSGLDLSFKRAKDNEFGGTWSNYMINENLSTLYPNEAGDYKNSSRYASNNNVFLQLPITAGYRLPVSDDVNLTFNAGIYTALGLYTSGTYSIWERNYTVTPEGEVINEVENDFQESVDGAGKFDFGLIGGIGIEYKRMALNVNYELGLVDQTSKTNRDKGGIGLKNKALTITVGYKF